jgi:hypothetical protein
VSVPPPCTVTVSKEDISLAADGGSIGVLVGVDGDTDPKLLAAAVSSPKDLDITRQPEIAGVSGRAFFVIKSLTNACRYIRSHLRRPMREEGSDRESSVIRRCPTLARRCDAAKQKAQTDTKLAYAIQLVERMYGTRIAESHA